MFLNNHRKFLSSTAIALVLTAMSNSSRAATQLVNGLEYGPDPAPAGFTVTGHSGNVNVAFVASAGEFFHIGSNGSGSLTNQNSDNATLTVEINNNNSPEGLTTSGIIFEDDVYAAGGNINLNVNESNAIFRGDIAGAVNKNVNITAKDSNIDTASIVSFEIANDENLNIDATINKELGNSDILNMNVANTSGNAARSITFQSNIGGVDASQNSTFISNLTIGDSGAAKTNNVNFAGSYLNTNGINIGVSGRAGAQNHISKYRS